MLREFGEDSDNSWFVDCALEYGGGDETPVPTQTITGLDHLEGRTVRGVADGSALNPMTVTGGAITLPQMASHVIAGLPYEMEVITVDPDVKAQDGSRYGSRKTLGPVIFELFETATLCAGPNDTHMEILKIPTTKQWGEPVNLFSGKIRSAIPGYARNEASIRFVSDDPFPATVLAVRTEVNVE